MPPIAPTADPLLEQALRSRLRQRDQLLDGMGELEPVALRLGLVQQSLEPLIRAPTLLIFAADHGLAVDGPQAGPGQQTHQRVEQILSGQQAVSVFARLQGLALSVVDCGVAVALPAHQQLIQRKIAHGTRNARLRPAMSLDQAQAAMRAGMEIGDRLRGNLLACAGLGLGSHESAALVLSQLTGTPLRSLMVSGEQMSAELLAHQMILVRGAHGRHRGLSDPTEVLAALGGFETAVMVGAMLRAASQRHLILVDGIAACAALALASRIAGAVTDYCIFCRSQTHQGLDKALSLFDARVLLDLGLDATDGTGACLTWPLVASAAALLSQQAEATLPGNEHRFETQHRSGAA